MDCRQDDVHCTLKWAFCVFQSNRCTDNLKLFMMGRKRCFISISFGHMDLPVAFASAQCQERWHTSKQVDSFVHMGNGIEHFCTVKELTFLLQHRIGRGHRFPKQRQLAMPTWFEPVSWLAARASWRPYFSPASASVRIDIMQSRFVANLLAIKQYYAALLRFCFGGHPGWIQIAITFL